MSLKSIEMQIALPRTHDAGKLQEQMQQRGQLLQDFASESVKKEDEKKMRSVMKQEKQEAARFHKDGKGREQAEQQGAKKEKKHKQQTEPHPYKGTRVDFSG